MHLSPGQASWRGRQESKMTRSVSLLLLRLHLLASAALALPQGGGGFFFPDDEVVVEEKEDEIPAGIPDRKRACM